MTLSEMTEAAYYAARQTSAKGGSNRDRADLLAAVTRDCEAHGLDPRAVVAAVEVRWINDTVRTLQGA